MYFRRINRLPQKGRKEIAEIVEEMKERDREERGTGMKVKKSHLRSAHAVVRMLTPSLSCFP